MTPGQFIAAAAELRRLPRVKIEMSGDEACLELHRTFTQRHARWRVVQNKAWAVALLRIPDHIDAYFLDPKQAHVRREFNRATRAGFTFAPIDALARLEEILDINRSAETRQGQPMHPAYMDEGKVRRYFERAADVFGVTDSTGVVRGYVCMRVCGDVACVERILGHTDVLKRGIMWVLLTGAIRELVARRETSGRPTWFMYDTFFGASPGLRQFKEWAGFEPHRVSWSWQE